MRRKPRFVTLLQRLVQEGYILVITSNRAQVARGVRFLNLNTDDTEADIVERLTLLSSQQEEEGP